MEKHLLVCPTYTIALISFGLYNIRLHNHIYLLNQFLQNITGSITLHKMQVYAFFLCKNILLKSYVKKDILAVSLISVWCETIKELELL